MDLRQDITRTYVEETKHVKKNMYQSDTHHHFQTLDQNKKDKINTVHRISILWQNVKLSSHFAVWGACRNMSPLTNSPRHVKVFFGVKELPLNATLPGISSSRKPIPRVPIMPKWRFRWGPWTYNATKNTSKSAMGIIFCHWLVPI